MLIGTPGVGESHLAIALGRAAIEAGHAALFITATALLATLSRAHREGYFGDQLAFFAKPKLLIVDELGYLPLERSTANLFFQLIATRYERGSILLTTNQQVTEWGHVFGDDTIAAAILDRLLHHSHTLVIKGELPTQSEQASRLARPKHGTSGWTTFTVATGPVLSVA